jgi:transposase-like protein
MRVVMRDLRDAKSTRDSAKRLGISNSAVGRMRKRAYRLIARKIVR